MMQQFGAMQPYGSPQGMMQSVVNQQRKMQPIGAGRSMMQQGGLQQQPQQGGAVRGDGNGYQQQGGVAQQDFAKVTANNASVDWDALGMLRR
jgi:hypothetical protein